MCWERKLKHIDRVPKRRREKKTAWSRDTRTRGVSFLRRDYGVSSNYGTRGWSEMHATRAFDRY